MNRMSPIACHPGWQRLAGKQAARLLLAAAFAAAGTAFANPELARGVAVFGEDPSANAQVLYFQGGRQMIGRLVEVTKDEVVWRHIDVDQPLRFGRKDVQRIAVSGVVFEGDSPIYIQKDRPKIEATSMATVKSAGADWLLGDVSSADGQTFSIAVSDSLRVDIPREQVAWMHFGKEPVAGAALSYANHQSWGISGGEVVDEKAGRVRFQANNFVAKLMGLPERFELAFELPVTKGAGKTSLRFEPYKPAPPSGALEEVRVTFSETAIETDWSDGTRGRQDKIKFPADIPAAADGWDRFRIFNDAVDQKITVFKNGKMAAQWGRCPRDEPVRRIAFTTRGEDLLLGNVRTKPWDGDFSALEKPMEGDRLSQPALPAAVGKLESISGTKARFSGEEKELKTGALLTLGEFRPGLEGADTLLVFGRQGEVMVADFEFRNGRFKGRTAFAPQLDSDAALLSAIAFPRKVPEPALTDVLIFKSGDELPGKLQSTGNGATILWSTGPGREFEIQPRRVAGIRLGAKVSPRVEVEKTVPKNADLPTLELANGDRISGTLAGFGKDTIRFKHATLGEREIALSAAANYFSVPVLDGASRWVDPNSGLWPFIAIPPQERWIEFDGAFFGHADTANELASLAKTGLKEMSRFEIRFETTMFATETPFLEFAMEVESSDRRKSLGLLFDNSKLTIRGSDKDLPLFPGISSEVRLKDEGDRRPRRRTVRSFVDTIEGSVAVMLNDEVVAKFDRLNDGLKGIGSTISFNRYRNAIKISNIWVAPWIGELPGFSEEPSKKTATSVTLNNGDVITGRLLGILDGGLKMGTDDGEFELPLGRILGIAFGGETKGAAAAARIRLRDGSIIHADEFRWEADALTAKSALLGDIKFSAAEVAELIIAPPAMASAKKGP